MVKLFTLVGLVRGGLVNVSSHEKQILFQKLGANNHFDNFFDLSEVRSEHKVCFRASVRHTKGF